METRIKQINYQIDKKLEELHQLNKRQPINYDLINGKEFDHLESLFEFENPISIKGQIREKQEVVEGLEKELSELKVVVKGDNLMFLNNEAVFNNKLMLTEKEAFFSMISKREANQSTL